ncbi:MAG: ankyrin repeat domain-containing protein [Fimbriimonadaceae bacterium]|nr:ankyrin repeat domain-containing protein [Fimbriimonadaceae bacterium]
MANDFTRRGFLGLVPMFGALPSITLGQDAPVAHTQFPMQDPALVQEIVGMSHANIDRVRELLAMAPALARCCYDWGFGDWESPLGAASHMGRQDIAELLIAHGARPDIFAYTILGQVSAVRAIIEANPGIQKTPGPHGITLLRHAEMGGEIAKPVHEYLTELGDAGIGLKTLPITDEEKQVYVGKYRFGPGETEVLEVVINNQGTLGIRRGDGFARTLNYVETHAFSPSGSAEVRVRFEVEEEKATGLSVHFPMPVAVARRI